MSALLQDLRHGVRLLLKSPLLTAAAAVSLALGIGANATVFTWVKAAMLRPLPGVPRQEGIVYFENRPPTGGSWSLSYPDYVDYRDRNQSLAGLFVQRELAMSLTTGDRPERVYGAIVSGNYFDVLEVRAGQGRTFLPEEDRTPGSHAVVVVSYRLWQRSFGADPALVGRTVSLNGRPFTVVGIAPRGFVGAAPGLFSDIWVPVMMQREVLAGSDRLEQRGDHWLIAMARLKPGVSAEQARADLNVVAGDLGRVYPAEDEGMTIELYPLWRAPGGAGGVLGPVLFVLAAVVGMVLLIACANVANLLLGRALDRRREIAIRIAMGATRARLVRQLLTESALLALAGGLAGIVVAWWSAGLLLSFLPPTDRPLGLVVNIDPAVLGFALLASLFTAFLVGAMPAFHGSRSDTVEALKEEGATVAGGRRKTLVRNSLVAGQIALSVVLLVGTGLFLRALQAAGRIDPGFNTRNIALAAVDLFPNGYSRESGLRFYERLLQRARALPGVEAAAVSRDVPLGFGGRSENRIVVEGYEPRKNENMVVEYKNVSPDYFQTMQILVVRGREFDWRDSGERRTVAVVNEAMASRFWPGQEPLGKRLRIGSDWLTVVGVASTIKYHSLVESTYPVMYLSILQAYRADVVLHVRTSGDPAQIVPAIRSEIRAMDPTLPVFDVRTMEGQMGFAVFAQRVGGTLLGIFGLLALVLASVGLYGVVSYAVGQRRHEIGIRMALGATPRDVLAQVLRHGASLVLVGLGIGAAGAAALARLVSSQLAGVSPTDPTTFAVVCFIMVAVATLATVLPARRASRLDPITVLRHQ